MHTVITNFVVPRPAFTTIFSVCIFIQLHERARELLKVANSTTKDISYKLARILPWEILRLDLQQYNKYGTFSTDQNLAELKKRTKACFTALEGKHGSSGKHGQQQIF